MFQSVTARVSKELLVKKCFQKSRKAEVGLLEDILIPIIGSSSSSIWSVWKNVELFSDNSDMYLTKRMEMLLKILEWKHGEIIFV